MEKSTPGRKPSEKKRAAILNAARTAFLSDGYAAASMNRIAETACVSKATLYNHFADKEALFGAVVEQRYQAVTDALPAFDPDAAPERALSDFAHALLKTIRTPEHVALVRLIIGEQARFPALSKIYFTVGKAAAYAKTEIYIASLRERKGYVIPDTKLAAGQFLGGVKELLYWPILFGGKPLGQDEAVVNAVVASVLKAWRPSK